MNDYSVQDEQMLKVAHNEIGVRHGLGRRIFKGGVVQGRDRDITDRQDNDGVLSLS